MRGHCRRLWPYPAQCHPVDHLEPSLDYTASVYRADDFGSIYLLEFAPVHYVDPDHRLDSARLRHAYK